MTRPEERARPARGDRPAGDGDPVARFAVAVTAFAITALGAILLAVGCGSVLGSGTGAWTGLPAGTRLQGFANPRLLSAVARLRSSGDGAAAQLAALAAEPTAFWAAGQPGDIAQLRAQVQQAALSGASPVIVAYNIPGRDACGHYSAALTGPGAAAYRAWISALAAAIGDSPALVIVEPDALADIVTGCLPPAQAAVRYELLRYAMRTLGALPRAHAYLDAGNPGMVGDPARLAGPLARAGIGYGRGLSANVANFHWTSEMVSWCQALERALAALRVTRLGAVVDTSRNGDGPYAGPGQPRWCNPPGRSPGPAPQVNPGPPGIDAYLWIKTPGASDGLCNGGPPAGTFWPQYAISLAEAWHR